MLVMRYLQCYIHRLKGKERDAERIGGDQSSKSRSREEGGVEAQRVSKYWCKCARKVARAEMMLAGWLLYTARVWRSQRRIDVCTLTGYHLRHATVGKRWASRSLARISSVCFFLLASLVAPVATSLGTSFSSFRRFRGFCCATRSSARSARTALAPLLRFFAFLFRRVGHGDQT